ncbi:MAG: hypothetical protein V3W34_09765 [Phycisphaerae bacterium]
MSKRHLALRAVCATLGVCWLFPYLWACTPKPETGSDPTNQSLLSLMPADIHIVEAFTAWADLDGKPGIDGIDVYVQPVNAAGDAIQAAGAMYVELHAYRPASADHKGRRLGIWDFALRSQEDQDTRWNRATQMYQFPIVLTAEARPTEPATKFVLSVTHNPPLGLRRSDEYILETSLAAGAFMGSR